MDVTLKFEDRFTLEQTLQWEFRNTGIELNVNDLKRLILDSFNQATETLHLQEIIPFSDCTIEIKLLMRGIQNNPVLAYFDMYYLKDDSTEFSFKLYADVLFPLIKSGDLKPLKTIWIHEIMHLMDYRELLKNLKIYKEKMEAIYYDSFHRFNQQIRKDKHIILLNLMMLYRAEGIATLAEYVMGGNKPNLLPPQAATEEFNGIISTAISLIYSVDFNSNQLATFLERVNPLAYQIGAGTVLTGLMKKHPEASDFTEIEKCLLNNEPCNFELNETLIQDIRRYDSFNFIEYSFDQEWLILKVRDLTTAYTDNLDIFEGFFDFLNRICRNNDTSGFVALLSNLLPEPMSFQQIEAACNKKNSDQVIPVEIRENMNTLYQHLVSDTTNEVCIWALTYTCADHDLLDDSIEYFGYIDDMEVLKTALQLV
jgi:hypothetical protein